MNTTFSEIKISLAITTDSNLKDLNNNTYFKVCQHDFIKSTMVFPRRAISKKKWSIVANTILA